MSISGGIYYMVEIVTHNYHNHTQTLQLVAIIIVEWTGKRVDVKS